MDGRADQYALAATAFRLFTGTLLFPHTNPAVVISHHLNTPPPKLGEKKPELAAFDAVMAKALAKDPEARYEDLPRLRGRARRGRESEGRRTEAGAAARPADPTHPDGAEAGDAPVRAAAAPVTSTGHADTVRAAGDQRTAGPTGAAAGRYTHPAATATVSRPAPRAAGVRLTVDAAEKRAVARRRFRRTATTSEGAREAAPAAHRRRHRRRGDLVGAGIFGLTRLGGSDPAPAPPPTASDDTTTTTRTSTTEPAVERQGLHHRRLHPGEPDRRDQHPAHHAGRPGDHPADTARLVRCGSAPAGVGVLGDHPRDARQSGAADGDPAGVQARGRRRRGDCSSTRPTS